jgi:hypothetical protein
MNRHGVSPPWPSGAARSLTHCAIRFCCSLQRRGNEAYATFKRAIEVNPRDSLAFNNLVSGNG